jgi:hypothetical protein
MTRELTYAPLSRRIVGKGVIIGRPRGHPRARSGSVVLVLLTASQPRRTLSGDTAPGASAGRTIVEDDPRPAVIDRQPARAATARARDRARARAVDVPSHRGVDKGLVAADLSPRTVCRLEGQRRAARHFPSTCEPTKMVRREREKERAMHSVHRRSELGGLIIGAVILFAGIYYLLRNTLGFDLDELNWEAIWPLLVIGLGVAILYGALVRSRSA